MSLEWIKPVLLGKGYFTSIGGFSKSYALHLIWKFLDLLYSKVEFLPKQSSSLPQSCNTEFLLRGRVIPSQELFFVSPPSNRKHVEASGYIIKLELKTTFMVS